MLNYLKQARRSANLTLQDMAYLLDMDFSNLSKYETGKKTPPTRVIIAYHIITKTPLKKLFKYSLFTIIDVVSSKTTSLINQLEEEMTSGLTGFENLLNSEIIRYAFFTASKTE